MKSSAKPAHLCRKGPQRVRVAADAVKAPKVYPDGYFLEPVRAWKQLQFVSQIKIDPRTRRFASEFARGRPNSAFDRHPLGLPGAVEFEGRGPGRLNRGGD
jgi:hypothetical protein